MREKTMKTTNPEAAPLRLENLAPAPKAYEKLGLQLAHTGWICQGSVVCRPLIHRINGRQVKKGPYYLWTCKVQGQTACVSLSQQQYQLIREAIANNRRLMKTIARMQALTLKTILNNVPGVTKRK